MVKNLLGNRASIGVLVLLATVGGDARATIGNQRDPGTSELPTTGALAFELAEDAWNGGWKHFDLCSAALIAGGLSSQPELDEYLRFFEVIRRFSAAQLTHSAGRLPADRGSCAARAQELAADPELTLCRAREVFEFMHREVLTGGYQAHVSQLGQTLRDGSYNCVTATVLFQCLCRAHGIDVVAVATRGHVFARLVRQPPIDVQTTCSSWADATKKDGHECESSWVESSDLREVNDVQLVAKIYYNRAVAELEKKNFHSAAQLLQHSLRADPEDRSARRNLIATLNNWSLEECERGNYTHAVGLLQEGAAIDPSFAPLLANDLHIHRQWILTLCRQNRYAEAIEILEQGYVRRPEETLFRLGRFKVYRLWCESFLRNGQPIKAWQVLDVARRRYPGNEDWLRYEAETIASADGDLSRQGHSR